MQHTNSSWLIAAVLSFVGTNAHAQSSEFDCALLGAEQAGSCIRRIAERSDDLERSVELWVRADAIERAEESVERAHARGPSEAVWRAAIAVGEAMIERRAHAAALRWAERWGERAKHEGSADVSAALSVQRGTALSAMGRSADALHAYRFVIELWSQEHSYTLGNDGAVLEEHPGDGPSPAAPIESLAQVAGTQPRSFTCVSKTRKQRSTFCIRAVRSVFARPARSTLTLSPLSVTPLEARVRAARPMRVTEPWMGLRDTSERTHPTRSQLAPAQWRRGNAAAGRAYAALSVHWFDALHAIERPPVFRGARFEAFRQWERRAWAEYHARWTGVFEARLVPMAQQAIASGDAEAALRSVVLLADGYYTSAWLAHESPIPTAVYDDPSLAAAYRTTAERP